MFESQPFTPSSPSHLTSLKLLPTLKLKTFYSLNIYKFNLMICVCCLYIYGFKTYHSELEN